MWHDSGELVGNESLLNNIYRLAGYPHEISEKTAPWTEARGVLPAMLKMKNPLTTDNREAMGAVLDQLSKVFARDRSRKQDFGADMWDKNTRWTPREWIAQAKEDYAKNDNSFVWTSIPDKISKALRDMGYDGILDTGGKMGGQSHIVAIPFGPDQVRSRFAKFDPRNEGKPVLLGSGATQPAGAVLAEGLNAMRDDRGYADGGAIDDWVTPQSQTETDDWTTPKEAPKSASAYDIARQIPTGFNEGLATVAGAPVDLTTAAINLPIRGVNAAYNALRTPGEEDAAAGAQPKELIPTIKKPFGGSESIKSGMGLVGINPDDLPAKTTAEKIARGGGEGVSMMLTPQAVLGAFTKAGVAITPRIMGVLEGLFGAPKTGGEVAANAVIGGLSGAGGSAASEAAPEGYKPIAEMGGAMAGGLGAVGLVGAGQLAKEGAKALRNYAAPMTEGGRERVAAETVRDAATSRAAAIDALENNPGEILPGSKPTAFQQSGDMGLGALERDTATSRPAEFNQRRADQNAARVDALSELQPTGSAADVSNVLRKQLRSIDDMTDQAVARATTEAQDAATGLGGRGSPEAYGDAIQAELSPQRQALTNTARREVEALGGGQQPEQYGASLRTAAADARREAKRQERALWNAVDPDNSLALPAGNLARTAQEIDNNVTGSARPIAGEERAILDRIGELGSVVPFREITDLRSRISTAMREELRASGETPVYGRLSRLRGAVEDAISNAVEHQVAQEQQAVSRGVMDPEQAMMARVNSWLNDFRSRRDGAVVGEDAGPVATGRGPRPTGVSGTASETGVGPGSSARGARGEEPVSNFDDSARDRLRAATAATRERAETYDRGPIGDILRTSGMQGQYRSLDAAVPAKIFRPGAGGFEAVQSYRRAVGNDAEALGVLSDYAAASLRRAAERADGTLDPRRVEAWQRQHRDALRAIPELDQRFGRAANASQALENYRPVRADVTAAHTPDQFFRPGKGGAEGVTQLRDLIGPSRADAILADYAASRLRASAMRPDGTIDPAKFEAWRKSHAEALRAMPELNDRFTSAAAATRAIDDVAALRRDALESFQKGSLAKVMNAPDAESATKTIGGIFGQKDAATQMRNLVAQTKNDPAARDGLRKAVADFMAARLISNTEAATSGKGIIKSDQFQTFLRENRTALREVFSDPEMNTLNAIAQDMQRANRSITAVKLPGQSNTAQDQASQQVSIMKKLMGHWIGAVGAGVGAAGGPWGAVAGAIGGEAVKALRDAGLKKVDDLVAAAMLDPKLAHSLLKAAPDKPEAGALKSLANALKRASVFAPAFSAASHEH